MHVVFSTTSKKIKTIFRIFSYFLRKYSVKDNENAQQNFYIMIGGVRARARKQKT